jgi:hypothetical protein
MATSTEDKHYRHFGFGSGITIIYSGCLEKLACVIQAIHRRLRWQKRSPPFGSRIESPFDGSGRRMNVDAILRQYSERKLNSLDAMGMLGIHCIEDLYSATLSAGFPLPRGSREEAGKQVESVLRFLNQQ